MLPVFHTGVSFLNLNRPFRLQLLDFVPYDYLNCAFGLRSIRSWSKQLPCFKISHIIVFAGIDRQCFVVC